MTGRHLIVTRPLDVGAQHGVDAGLIASALTAKIIEHVVVDTHVQIGVGLGKLDHDMIPIHEYTGLIGIGSPLAAKGLPIARAVADTLVLAVLVDRRDAIAQMGRHSLDPAGAGGYRGEPPIERGMVTGFNHRAPPRR